MLSQISNFKHGLEFYFSRSIDYSIGPLEPRGQGGGIASPDFDISVNPIKVAADYAHHIHTLPRIFRPSYGPLVCNRTTCVGPLKCCQKIN